MKIQLLACMHNISSLSLIHYAEHSGCISVWFRLFSHLHLSWACASSKWFLRNRSRAAMQSSRASDRSDREHLQNQNKHGIWMRKERVLKIRYCLINKPSWGLEWLGLGLGLSDLLIISILRKIQFLLQFYI